MTTRQERQANRDKLMLARLKELKAEVKKPAAKPFVNVPDTQVKPKPVKAPVVVETPKPVVEKKAPVRKSVK